MRVVQLLPELNEGGVERGVVELNRELVKRGIESIVISAGGGQARQIAIDGGKHFNFDLCSKNVLTSPVRIMRLRNLFRELQPDILHARSRVPAWLAWLANKPLQIPFVTTVHGFNSVNVYSRVMTYGDRVICVSQAIKDYIQDHYGVADELIQVVPRGVDLEEFDPEIIDEQFVSNFSRRYGLEGQFVVSAVGRVTQLKDLATFIKALAIAKKAFPELSGLIVGSVREDKQDYYQSLKNLCEQLQATDYIHFVPGLRQVAEIYSLSSLLVSCSKKPESFGRSAAEAIAMQIPVIATAHGGILDIVHEGETGFLFEVGDSVQLADKIILAKNHTLTGLREFILSHFGLETMVDKTVAIYAELLAEKGSS